MPTTSVENSSGTINDLIMRRKMDENTLRSVAAQSWWTDRADSGYATPTAMPTTIEMMIHCDSVMRRRNDFWAGARCS